MWGTKWEDLLGVWESQQQLVGLGDGVLFPKQIENSPTKNPNKSNCVSMRKYQFINSVNKLEGQKMIFEVFYFDFNLYVCVVSRNLPVDNTASKLAISEIKLFLFRVTSNKILFFFASV